MAYQFDLSTLKIELDGKTRIDYKKLEKAFTDCASTMQPSEICTDAVKHFNLFHEMTERNRFICFFFDNGEFKIQLILPKRKITPEYISSIVLFSNQHKFNTYISEFSYLTYKNRKESNVFATNVITLDLDRKEVDINTDLPIIQKIAENNGLHLSAVMSSGRGHYIVFKLDEPYICCHNAIYLDRWKWNYDRICDLFQEWEADYKCKDISRVFRLIGTHNYKDKREYNTCFLNSWNQTSHYVDIPICKKTIDDNMFTPHAIAAAKNNGIVPKRKKKTAVSTNTDYLTKKENKFFKNQNKNRLNDLVHLLVMREDHTGDRHAFLYVIINQLNAAGYSYQQALDYIVREVNTRFSLAESEYEITRQLQHIYKHNKEVEEFDGLKTVSVIENDYHCPTTSTILRLLNITEQEQDELKILKTKEKLFKLRQDKRLTKLRCDTQNKKEEKRNAINSMAATLSIEEISEQSNLKKSTVYKKLEKTPKQIQMEKENDLILSLYNEGCSVAKISEKVGLSYETTKKRLQKIKKEEVVENVISEESMKVESFAEIVSENTTLPETFADIEAISEVATDMHEIISNTNTTISKKLKTPSVRSKAPPDFGELEDCVLPF